MHRFNSLARGLLTYILPLVLAVFAPSPIAAQTSPVEVARKTMREDVFPIRPTPFPPGIVAMPGIEFANLVGFRPMRLDLYAHADRQRARPAIVWIHGGGWNRGDARTSASYANWPAVLASLAARGYVVASVDYRLTGEARFPAQVQDVKAAVRFLRANAARFGIDSEQIILWGGSAGGHLASLAATSCGDAAFEPEPSTGRLDRAAMSAVQQKPGKQVSDCVSGLALWYGVFDLRGLTGSNVDQLLGCASPTCAKKAFAASPITHAGPGDPPTLIIHGLADKTASPDAAKAFAAALRDARVPVEELYLPGIEHGWEATAYRDQVAAHRTALERTFHFFDGLTNPKRPR